MTFAALPPWLAWLLILTAVGAAAAIFVIRSRAPQRVISSFIVWRQVLDEARERSFWDRIRWAVSLALTAMIAAAIAVALTRPEAVTGASGSGRALIVIDSSWSMGARTPSGPTRWERAIQDARALVLTSNARELALATTADGVVEGPTGDRSALSRALDRLRPNAGDDRTWPRVANADEVHFFTDGAQARALAPEVVVHSVFAPAPNVAVTAFEVEPAPRAGAATHVFLAVANHASTPQAVRVTVTRGGDVALDRSVDVRGGESHRETISVPSEGDARFRVHVSAANNALEIDDDAVAWLWTAEPLRVAVVGVASAIPALLAQDTSLRVMSVDPAAYRQATADVWVFDRWLPPEVPTSPSLIIDPPETSWLGPRGAEEADPQWMTGPGHPILDGVDAALLRVRQSRGITRPALQPVVVSARNTPLVAVEDSSAGRFVVMGVSTANSNLAATPVFPVLVGNAVDWLGRPQRGMSRQPGPVSLPATTRRVIAPNGESLPLVRLDDRVTTRLDRNGLYLVEGAGGRSVLRVRLADMERSNLLTSSVEPDGPGEATAPIRMNRAWWIYAAWLAVGLVALEWITWRRRITV